MTSNLAFEDWTSVFGSERLTGALLDRLTYHFRILKMNGDSYHLKQSKARSKAGSSAVAEFYSGKPACFCSAVNRGRGAIPIG